ncbi:hypothetical protein B566_EDAN012153 [Ephemera danica]|nr:hypothetical protein B566_EDAN012153 [Ephemera danica]
MLRCSPLLLLLLAAFATALPHPLHHGDHEHEHPHPEPPPTMEMEKPSAEIKPMESEMPTIEMKPVEMMEVKPVAEEMSSMEEMKPVDEQIGEMKPVEMIMEVKPTEAERSEVEEAMPIVAEMKPIDMAVAIKPMDEEKGEMEEVKPVEVMPMEETKPIQIIPLVEMEVLPMEEHMGEKPTEIMIEIKPTDEVKNDMEESKPVEIMLLEEIKPIEIMPMEEQKGEIPMEELPPMEILPTEEQKIEIKPVEMIMEIMPMEEVKSDVEDMKPVETMPMEEIKPIEEQKGEMPMEEVKPVEIMPMEEMKPMDEQKGEMPMEEMKPAVAEKQKEEDSKRDTAETYEGAQMLRVKAVTPEQKHLLNSLQEAELIDTWLRPAKGKGDVDIMVPGEALPFVKQRLADLNTEYRIVIPDVQRAIEAENPPMSEEDQALADRKGYRMTWQSYHPLQDIHDYIDYLAQTYPDICSVTTIGSSVEGRPLKVLRISSRKQSASGSRPAIWIDGGIHAREWISPASVTYIIQQLVENYEDQGAIAEDIDYYILPVVNPDGYEYTRQRERLWRKNRKDPHLGRCAGTDLNRNWGYKWGGPGSSRDKCKEIYAGASAFSEPETQAIKNFVSGQASNMRAYITFHSYGQYILYPWGYDRKVPPDYADLDRVGKQAAAAMRSAGGASYTLRDRGQYGFLLPASFIQPTGKEAFAAVKTIAQAVLKP